MRSLFMIIALLSAVPALADSVAAPVNPEVFSVRILPRLKRCVGDTAMHVIRCEKNVNQKIIDAQIRLDQCQTGNFYGNGCGGTWEQELEVDGVKFNYSIYVSHFENPNFKYMISTHVCRAQSPEDKCNFGTLLLKDATLPFETSFNGPSFWVNHFGGGEGYDSAVLYTGDLQLGEGADKAL